LGGRFDIFGDRATGADFMALVGMGAASANRSQFLAMTRMSGYFSIVCKGWRRLSCSVRLRRSWQTSTRLLTGLGKNHGGIAYCVFIIGHSGIF